jgi:DNA modification methylase
MNTKRTKSSAADASATLLSNTQSAIERRLGPIEYRKPGDLTPYEGNPRKHPEKQLVQLVASIDHFGFAYPLLIDVHGVVITGHARLEAAVRLGMTEVPVLVAEHWTRSQVRAYRLADNELSRAAVWDLDLLKIELSHIVEIGEVPIEIMGWSTAEIDVVLAGSKNDRSDPDDEVPETPERPVARHGDIWLLGKHRLMCGSSLEPECWVRLMNGKTGHMVLTDAPFNVRVNGHVSGSNRFEEFAMASGEMSPAEFTEFNATYLRNMTAHLKDGAIMMAFMDHGHLHELMSATRQVGLKHINLCVWKKSNGGMGSLWRSQHELVLVVKYGTAPHTNTVELGKHGRYRTNIWEVPGANSFGATRDQDLADHPTVKPTKLLTEAIRDVTRQGEIVLDAFAGSGSIFLACERAKRIGYAIEIEPGYIDVSIRRWEAMTGQEALLEETGECFAEVRTIREEESDEQSFPLAAE